jgi:hypothetical protein
LTLSTATAAEICVLSCATDAMQTALIGSPLRMPPTTNTVLLGPATAVNSTVFVLAATGRVPLTSACLAGSSKTKNWPCEFAKIRASAVVMNACRSGPLIDIAGPVVTELLT